MANQWFRMYAEFANDPKVQMLSETDQRRYIMLLCIRCNGDVTLQDEEVAFQLRISNEEWLATKVIFVSKGLIADDNKPTAWDKRQFSSDSSAARVSKHRAKKKEQCNVTVTPQIQNRTDTDISTNVDIKPEREKSPRFDARAHLVSLGVDAQIASEWISLKKRNKAAPTELVIKGMVREAASARISLSDAMTMQVENGWKGFKAEYAMNQPRNGKNQHQINQDATTRAIFGNARPVEKLISGEVVR